MGVKNFGVAVVVEDYKLIADTLKRLLLEMDCFESVLVCYSSEDFDSIINEVTPGLILMDINIKGQKNGLEITKELIKKNPEHKVMVFSMHNEAGIVKRAINFGAKAYVTKNSPVKEIKVAVEKVLNGKFYLCEEIAHLRKEFPDLSLD